MMLRSQKRVGASSFWQIIGIFSTFALIFVSKIDTIGWLLKMQSNSFLKQEIFLLAPSATLNQAFQRSGKFYL